MARPDHEAVIEGEARRTELGSRRFGKGADPAFSGFGCLTMPVSLASKENVEGVHACSIMSKQSSPPHNLYAIKGRACRHGRERVWLVEGLVVGSNHETASAVNKK